MRPAHYLKKNAQTEQPTRCIFIDTETLPEPYGCKGEKHNLRLGAALYKRRYKGDRWSAGDWLDFKDIDTLWDFVCDKVSPGSKLYLYAHNLIYDLTVTQGIKCLTDRGWKITKALIDDPPTVIQFRIDNRSILMIDSFNYFRTSLANIGASIGISKHRMPRLSAADSVWAAYCRRDVEVLATAMITYFSFISSNKLGNYQITIAAQAFSAYRHRFMEQPIFIDNNEKALALARSSYHGGRTEAFYIGSEKGSYYTLDVNSMYPAVMALNHFPVKLWTVMHKITLDELKDYMDNYCVIADVDIDTDDPAYPVYIEGKLLFPVGQFTASLTTPELKHAQALGHIVKVNRAALYYKAPMFRAYVAELYRLRREYATAGNASFSWLCKIMLNSLYGKFGQLGRVYEEIDTTDPDEVKVWTEYDVETKTVHRMRSFGGVVQELTSTGESFNSHPAIASHVAAYGRMELWRLINLAGLNNVYYADTDSITVNSRGMNNIPDAYISSELGYLKVEAHFRKLTIYGAKDYVFGSKTRIKGIRSKAVCIAPGHYRQERFSKFKTMLRAGDINTMTIHNQDKHLKRIYTKGTVTDSGRVVPLRV